MPVRAAGPAERDVVRAIVDAAMLELEDATLERSIVLAAVEDGRVSGGLVLDDREIVAVAVRRGDRGEGLGRALVEAAAARRPVVTASFDPSVRPFYVALGFDVTCREGRCHGVRRA